MDRRSFLSAAGLGGFSLVVDARDLFAAGPEPPGTQVSSRPSAGYAPSEPHMIAVDLTCDVLVAGGGMSGVCAALAAARHGARVILVQDRSRLGGNASSEVRMHIVGADQHGSRAGWRESGLIEELRLEDAVHNSHRAWELWDLMLYDKVVSEPNITLLLDSVLFSAVRKGDAIEEVFVRCDKTEHLYRIRSKIFCDCTGDARLALEAGATFRRGHEARAEFGESYAPEEANSYTQGSSILFTSRQHDRPMPFVAPSWARKITKDHLKHRGIGSWEYGYWWIELGGMVDTIRDNERLRFELLSVVMGVWDYIKNSGNHPDSANWALETVGMIPGKRESRRIVGDYILTQKDIEGGWKSLPDAVAYGGWAIDEHPPTGFDDPSKPPFTPIKIAEPYNIPLGALYSKDVRNLMMAGRNISCSHVAFCSTRVMATCAVEGQAVGTAAALCAREGITPRQLRQDASRMKRLQQVLVRDDQTIRNLKNEDPDDLARTARVTACDAAEGSQPENILTGITRDLPGKYEHRWAGTMGTEGAWIELSWDRPQTIGHVQITFDTGFHRELTLSASDNTTKHQVRGPQPETIRDYTLAVRTPDGTWKEVTSVEGNYHRLRRHDFPPVVATALRLHAHATHGSPTANVFEVRAYKS